MLFVVASFALVLSWLLGSIGCTVFLIYVVSGFVDGWWFRLSFLSVPGLVRVTLLVFAVYMSLG